MSSGEADVKHAEAGVLSAEVARGLRESAFWIFGALALILFVALASYDRSDPAFSSTGQPGPVTNLIGPFGAWLSDLLFVLFGAPAFLFPVMLGLAGWALFQERSGCETDRPRSLGVSRPRVRCSRSRAVAGSRRCTSRQATTRTRPAACSARCWAMVSLRR